MAFLVRPFWAAALAIVIPPGPPFAFQRRNSKELLTTKTELNAIAAPATTGLTIPKATNGTLTTL